MDELFEEEKEEKEQVWALSLEWWEYLMLFIEAILIVYTLLVMLGLVPLPG